MPESQLVILSDIVNSTECNVQRALYRFPFSVLEKEWPRRAIP